MTAQKRVLFLCPHNAAKSVLAVAEFNRLAQQRGMTLGLTRRARSQMQRHRRR